MKCLSEEESKNWLKPIRFEIGQDGNLILPARSSNIMVTMPQKAVNLSFFSEGLVAWLKNESPRLIWISEWLTYPFQLIPVTKMRLGCGESRQLAGTPGHLFDKSSEEGDSVMAGLIFFIMAFNWSAYAVAQNNGDYIYIGDGYLIFSSSRQEKLQEATDLIRSYKLNVIQNNREAWK